MKKHSKRFNITFRDADKTGKLTINSLVDFMQEIAIEHATILDVNFDKEHSKYYWVIIRTKIDIVQMPKVDEFIKIETYPAGVDKMYTVRHFDIFDKNDKKIGEIKGYYLLMEHNKMMPVKIKGNDRFQLFNNTYEGEKVDKLKPTNAKVIKKVIRKAFSSDIDVNGHMNNAHYVRWCLDMYDTNELATKEVKSFQMQYVKEILENEEVEVYRYSDDLIIGKIKEEISFVCKCQMEEIYNK